MKIGTTVLRSLTCVAALALVAAFNTGCATDEAATASCNGEAALVGCGGSCAEKEGCCKEGKIDAASCCKVTGEKSACGSGCGSAN